ncbi:MAG TPA: PD-(D/E)XK nuclease family protein [Nitrospinota bacterium]|nr:PD-(D/E)XK nuclease family protein [Nitrospinota bacterium]
MNRTITYSLSEDLIKNIADLLYEEFFKKGKDLHRIACVFGGKRPALFLRRELSKRIEKSFISPRFFSIDEFMDYIISQNSTLKLIAELDACYLIYKLSKKSAPDILKGRESFNQFLPWAKEIVTFIEQIDLEGIEEESLKSIQKSSEIGYEIPENINVLLQHIIKIRKAYHKSLNKEKSYSRGLIYLQAAKTVNKKTFLEFDTILFCNFYYLHKTELAVIRDILRREKGILIFQGSEDDWSVLEKDAEKLHISIKPEQKREENYNLNLYEGFDMHSQVSLVREIMKEISKKEDTVIVLPRPELVVPLLSEISSSLDEFNVSMGYPIKRSSIYALFDLLFRVQKSRKDSKYYARDYIDLLKHPLVKNLKLGSDPAITRVLVHKIEELLLGSEKTKIGGSLFLELSKIENEEEIYQLASQTLKHMEINIGTFEAEKVFKQLHKLLFFDWEDIRDFKGFAEKLSILLDTLVERSMVWKFPFNLKVILKLYSIKEELEGLSFSEEQFEQREIWEIFKQKLEGEMVSFEGSPLRGTQVLGLFETRSLNFENVIVMDMNESILPKLKIYEPLIPREVMLSLGLNRLEKEEEIQHYHFMRLISNAQNVHLIYEENREKEKSRFIEELLWNRQKELNRMEALEIPKASFKMDVSPKESSVEKTEETIDFLKKATYSSSRLNTYMNCPLKFYFQYVLGLEEREDLLEGPEVKHIGKFIHELLKETFQPFIKKRPLIDEGFKKYFFKTMEKEFEEKIERRMKSDSFLLKGIIKARLKKFLEREEERDVSKILSLEEKLLGAIKLNSEPINFIYIVDRIDEFDKNRLVIIDYKTGGSDLVPKKLKTLDGMEMTRESIRENIKSFQLPLYYHFTSKDFPEADINAELYNIKTLKREAFIRDEDLDNKERIMEICLEAMNHIFKEIFDPNLPFSPDRDERKCQYCSFPLLCK